MHPPHLRIARPVSDLTRSVAQCMQGLGIAHLGSFEDHAGFDGAMLGTPGKGFHLEFTRCSSHPVVPTPTAEDLLVFYVPEFEAWLVRCDAMLAAGFVQVPPFNPYWAQAGRSFEDLDGYQVVIQCAAWDDGQGGRAPSFRCASSGTAGMGCATTTSRPA